MITKFLTGVSTKFNPFSPRAKVCRIFLAQMPPDARRTMQVKTKLLPRTSEEGSSLALKFSDGKEMAFDTEKWGIKDVMEEVDRHSRGLQRKQDLKGN
ncbi:39S ribosomal protein L44, mitochondrial [Agyrium rufum]|nr:39S ribosomal protein L44, mitochondrial [Agyrium rufum]